MSVATAAMCPWKRGCFEDQFWESTGVRLFKSISLTTCMTASRLMGLGLYESSWMTVRGPPGEPTIPRLGNWWITAGRTAAGAAWDNTPLYSQEGPAAKSRQYSRRSRYDNG